MNHILVLINALCVDMPLSKPYQTRPNQTNPVQAEKIFTY